MNTPTEDPNYKLQLCLALLNLGTRNCMEEGIGKSIKHFPKAHDRYCRSNFENLYKQANLLLRQSQMKPKVIEMIKDEGEMIKKKQTLVGQNVSDKNLSEFLNQKPKPSWSHRIEMLYLYRPNYVIGWRKGLSSILQKKNKDLLPIKIIINKKILAKVAKFSCKTNRKKEYTKFYKSTSRGIEEYLKRYDYHRQTKYERKKLVFVLSTN
ncbi:hypothetical protein M0812_14254 [Anaeramoeba flamelloides]|uniref:Uncharacterized protein n=1 Tax=Anaeramoeba flamelloides TaxID=1746091 RepID=A0AAV7ZH60_9EUKA|nr:hypothetical protein M0812_14254 [Anaeramoeba flamelloides]